MQAFLSMMPKYRLYLQSRLRWLALMALAAVAVGQLPLWYGELFSHFLPYYALLFLLAAVLDRRLWRLLWCLAALGAVCWLMQGGHRAGTAAAEQRLLWYNAHLHNAEAAAEVARIRALAPDFVAIGEIHPEAAPWQALRADYPQGCAFAEDSSFALLLWSRRPLEHCQVQMAADYPYILARSADVHILAVHPPPPITADLAAARRAYLQIIAAEAAKHERIILVGDLNSSPFSPLFRRLLAEADLQTATPYYLPTWRPFFLNIDHILGRNVMMRAEALPWLGSDHRPLLLNFAATGDKDDTSPD